MIREDILSAVLDHLCKAQRDMNLDDYIAIWGEHLGNHIWRQEGSDLLRIWTSGLNDEEKAKFISYVANTEKFKGGF